MGPQFLPADLARSVNTDRTSARADPLVESSATEFDDYLDHARAAQEIGRAQPSEERESPDDEPDEEAGDATAPRQQALAPSPIAIELATDAQAVTPDPAAAPRQEAQPAAPARDLTILPTTPDDTASTRSADPSEGSATKSQPGPAAPSPARPAGGDPQPMPSDPAAVQESRPAAPIPKSVGGESLQTRNVTTPDLTQASPSPERTPLPANSDPAMPTLNGPKSDSRPILNQPHASSLDGSAKSDASAKPVETPLKPVNPNVETGPMSERESIHARKVADSIEHRKQGSGDSHNQQAGRQAATSSGRPTPAGQPGRPGQGFSRVIAGLENAFVQAEQGDSTAGTIGRFLLGGAPDPAAADPAALTPRGDLTQIAARPGAASTGQTAPSPGLAAANAGDPAVSTLDGPNAMAAAARVLSASNTAGRFSVALQLNPPELGQVKLNIQMHQQTMVLQVDVQSRAVAKLVESRIGELRDALAVHGVRVDRTDVVVRPPASAEAGMHQQHGQSGGDASGQSSDDALEHDAGSPDGRSARSSHDPGSDRTDARPAHEAEASKDIFTDPDPDDGVAIETRTTELSLDLVA